MKIDKVHISYIQISDTILCKDNIIRTVGKDDIQFNYNVYTLFGDSYSVGYMPVNKVIFTPVVYQLSSKNLKWWTDLTKDAQCSLLLGYSIMDEENLTDNIIYRLQRDVYNTHAATKLISK